MSGKMNRFTKLVTNLWTVVQRAKNASQNLWSNNKKKKQQHLDVFRPSEHYQYKFCKKKTKNVTVSECAPANQSYFSNKLHHGIRSKRHIASNIIHRRNQSSSYPKFIEIYILTIKITFLASQPPKKRSLN